MLRTKFRVKVEIMEAKNCGQKNKRHQDDGAHPDEPPELGRGLQEDRVTPHLSFRGHLEHFQRVKGRRLEPHWPGPSRLGKWVSVGPSQ